MSLNQICNYDNTSDGYISIRVNDLYIDNDFNVALEEDTVAGDQLVVGEDDIIEWLPTSSIAGEALEHFQARFGALGTEITSTSFVTIPIHSPPLTPDPLGKVSLDGDKILISNNLRAVFMLIVKYCVHVNNQTGSYEFKLQRNFSNPYDDEKWVDFQDYGRVSSIVINHDIYSDQTLTCQFPIDTYGNNDENTYIRFLCKKSDPASPDAAFIPIKTCISMIRIV